MPEKKYKFLNNRDIYFKVCLNGNITTEMHNSVPITPQQLAMDAYECLALGAQAIHVHAREIDESETLAAQKCAEVIRVIRKTCGNIPLGLTTSLTAEPDPDKRLYLVRQWNVIPDFVSVNFNEPKSIELCRLLTEKGIGIEMGLWTVHDAHQFLESGLVSHCLRVLVEVFEESSDQAIKQSREISHFLHEEDVNLPQIHHGEGIDTWAVIKDARQRGHGIRIGLEDTLVGPKGNIVSNNRELVSLAIQELNL
ncbi:3-keto-5-aminohexanoate cleavage protein [Aneurinibacillus sp. REN35]|uniref:3-keto-5-aminohexanoate cleavage protein n=1 Tax=Aneurinibacillus sp. REN35 TaxID=3237286 RepID=UPI0035281100